MYKKYTTQLVKPCFYWCSERIKMNRKLSLWVLILLLVSCSKDNSTKVEYQAFSCTEFQSICEKKLAEGKLEILFNVAKIAPESEVTLKLNPTFDKSIEKVIGFIEGKSMYMGKIPLLFSAPSSQEEVQATFMLGSCSDPKMIWQTRIEVHFVDGTKTSFFFDFTSFNG